MACEEYDLKAYLLGELTPEERRQVERHLEVSPGCREELEQLRLTLTALRSLPELEPLRRVQFVSDKVFEPGFWRRMWHSGPQLGFAGAALLALAIVVHAFYRPAPAQAPAPEAAAIRAQVLAEVEARLEEAVARAVAESEKRQQEWLRAELQGAEERMRQQRQADLLAAEDYLNAIRKQLSTLYLASSDFRSGR